VNRLAPLFGARDGRVSMRSRLVFFVGLVVLVLGLADAAFACTVCVGAQTEATRKAFVGTTALLTFLPLAVVGSVVTLFVRRTLAREEREEAQRLEGIEGLESEAQRVA